MLHKSKYTLPCAAITKFPILAYCIALTHIADRLGTAGTLVPILRRHEPVPVPVPSFTKSSGTGTIPVPSFTKSSGTGTIPVPNLTKSSGTGI